MTYSLIAMFILSLIAVLYLLSPVMFPQEQKEALNADDKESLDEFIRNEEELDAAMGKSD